MDDTSCFSLVDSGTICITRNESGRIWSILFESGTICIMLIESCYNMSHSSRSVTICIILIEFVAICIIPIECGTIRIILTESVIWYTLYHSNRNLYKLDLPIRIR